MADAPHTEARGPPDEKLPRVPEGARVLKRPLLRRPQPASAKTPVVYVSSSTSFLAAVKRVRKQLDRGLRSATAAAPKNASMRARVAALQRDAGAGGDGTAVTLVGAGRAVEKTLAVAACFERRGDCVVRLRTGTVGAVDDVVVDEGDAEDESRVRKLSCLEVVISLK